MNIWLVVMAQRRDAKGRVVRSGKSVDYLAFVEI